MKKFFLAFACAVALCATSCSSSPESKVESTLKDYTTKFKKVNSLEELQTLSVEFAGKMMEFQKEYPDMEGNDKLNSALETLQSAAQEAAMRVSQ